MITTPLEVRNAPANEYLLATVANVLRQNIPLNELCKARSCYRMSSVRPSVCLSVCDVG